MLLSFLLWSLRCISLLHIIFHCQVGILVFENSVYTHRRLYILTSQERRDMVTRTFAIGANELNALTKSMYTTGIRKIEEQVGMAVPKSGTV